MSSDKIHNKKSVRLVSKLIEFLAFLSLVSCLTPIDLEVNAKGGRLVVSGQISTLPDQSIVELGLTTDTNTLPVPLKGASVKVIDDQGSFYRYFEIKPGTYSLSGYKGIAGHTYYIEVGLPSGQIYKSIPEKMPVPSVLDSVTYEIASEEVVDAEGIAAKKNFYKLYANSSFESTKGFLKWTVDEAFLLSPTDFPDIFGSIPPPCFIVQNSDPQRIALFDESTTSSKSIQRILIASREIDWTFYEKHYFTSIQSSITKESFEYWRKVNILANQVGSIFDSPPAAIVGNIVNSKSSEELVLGYFQAANQTYKRKFFLPNDLPFPLLFDKCDFVGDRSNVTAIPNTAAYPPRCIDCTIVRNSSYIRPVWF